MEATQLADTLFTAYESGYHNPRGLHYTEIQEEFETNNLSETDAVADAFDLGCRHAGSGTRFNKEELLEEMASW